MLATKETAAQALVDLNTIVQTLTTSHGVAEPIIHLREFLESARRKLPTDAAVVRDRSKKRNRRTLPRPDSAA